MQHHSPHSESILKISNFSDIPIDPFLQFIETGLQKSQTSSAFENGYFVPQELIQKIASYLDPNWQLQVALVCKYWSGAFLNELLYRYKRKWKKRSAKFFQKIKKQRELMLEKIKEEIDQFYSWHMEDEVDQKILEAEKKFHSRFDAKPKEKNPYLKLLPRESVSYPRRLDATIHMVHAKDVKDFPSNQNPFVLHYRNFSDALRDARDGDVILLQPGIHVWSGTIPVNVELIGNSRGRNEVIIEAENSSQLPSSWIIIEKCFVRFCNLMFRDTKTSVPVIKGDYGIYEIDNCEFYGNGCVEISDSCRAIIRHCVFHGQQGAAINIHYGSIYVLIESTEVYNTSNGGPDLEQECKKLNLTKETLNLIKSKIQEGVEEFDHVKGVQAAIQLLARDQLKRRIFFTDCRSNIYLRRLYLHDNHGPAFGIITDGKEKLSKCIYNFRPLRLYEVCRKLIKYSAGHWVDTSEEWRHIIVMNWKYYLENFDEKSYERGKDILYVHKKDITELQPIVCECEVMFRSDPLKLGPLLLWICENQRCVCGIATKPIKIYGIPIRTVKCPFCQYSLHAVHLSIEFISKLSGGDKEIISKKHILSPHVLCECGHVCNANNTSEWEIENMDIPTDFDYDEL